MREALRQKDYELHRAENSIRVWEGKINDTQHYINKLKEAQSDAQNCQDLLQKRIQSQKELLTNH